MLPEQNGAYGLHLAAPAGRPPGRYGALRLHGWEPRRRAPEPQPGRREDMFSRRTSRSGPARST